MAGVVVGFSAWQSLYAVIGRHAFRDLILGFAVLALVALFRYKCPWVRQPILALIFAGFAGIGASVAVLCFIIRYVVDLDLGAGILPLGVGGAVLFIAGILGAYHSRSRSTSFHEGTLAAG
jgi:hypothetical protein